MADVTALFKKGGGLSSTLSHFELREGQIELVAAIESAIENRQHLLAEAGTGIGKTFSYLLPTLAQNKQAFVSTATKHLQDQIFFKDLPIIEQVLGRKVSACLLKGRSNYFCHYRYEEFFGSRFSLNKKQVQKANQVRKWSEKTLTGDLGEVAEFTDGDIGFQKRITSTTDNCAGGECPYFDVCFVQKVREKAKKSELVIVNHALLMADIMLKETGFAEILPEVDVVVIDEAHHLPKIATQAFAEQVTANQLLELARDALQIYRVEANDMEGFEAAIDHLIAAVKDFNEALTESQKEGQIQLGQLKQWAEPYQCFKRLMQAFKPVLMALEQLSERSSDLEKIYERAAIMAARIKNVFSLPQTTKSPEIIKETTAATENLEIVADKVAEEKGERLKKQLAEETSHSHSVAILEWNADYFRAARLPIQLGNRFRFIMQNYAESWLFVSATLSVNGSFQHFKSSLGLPYDIPERIVESPFDYARHAVIHVMSDLPEPNQPQFVERLVKQSIPIIEKVGGRTFMLFTSYRNLNEAAEWLEDTDFNLFVQGDLPKSQLIEAFIQSDNAVLLGTVSFWEGVDVHGENLSCVIIDKIPFPSPTDPIIAEQSRYLESEGKNSFAYCYIPQAATLLKQGAGRLIRSTTDKGILVFGDGRMLRKSYGKQLINSMPPARQVDSAELMDFIEKEL